jgi:hypothetical protein
MGPIQVAFCTEVVTGVPNFPVPSFRNTVIVFEFSLETAISGLPSPLKSATAKPCGFVPPEENV